MGLELIVVFLEIWDLVWGYLVKRDWKLVELIGVDMSSRVFVGGEFIGFWLDVCGVYILIKIFLRKFKIN